MKFETKELKKVLELASFYQEKILEIASSSEKRDLEAAGIIKKMSQMQIADTLRSLDVGTVNRDKLGIRVSALRDAGIKDMEQLCAMSYKQLSRLKGIGEESAYLIYKVAGKIRKEVSDGFGVSIYPDKKDEVSTELIQIISRANNELPYVKEALAINDKYASTLSEALKMLKNHMSLFKRIFSSAAKKAAAEKAAEYIFSLMEGDYGRRCDVLIQAWERLQVPSVEECWLTFERNSAAFYARIEQLDKISGIKIDNNCSGLPLELVREVEQQKIDLSGLKATLRTYQDFGVRYIVRQQNVLLGDEMGLGKTVQAIAAMVALAAAGESHFMVVCPASVLVNWAREIKQFSNLNVVTIRGGDIQALRGWLNEGGVAVTTYGSISRFSLPEAFRYGLLVADEAHYIKNPLARRTQALLILKKRAKNCLFMTGTPLENRVDEMCYIIKCLRPDLAEDIEDLSYFTSAAKFREKLAPVYLRRTRDDVLSELPDLIEKEQWCQMGKAEWESYLLSVMAENFMAMRQVSWDVAEITKSSKAKRLLQLCEMAADEGRKTIVFSYFLDTLNTVKKLLGDRALDVITGAVSSQKRQKIVDDFTAAENGAVLLCQVQAGGTGLNIQAASVVIFCEPQIKPSIENQAISRAYRMGQSRSVMVHRLLCENTVDERIMEILREKQDVFDSFAEESVTGSEYIKGEKSISSAIVAQEKDRLTQQQSPEDFEEDDDE